MKTLLLGFMIVNSNNSQTLVHELSSAAACDAYAQQIATLHGLQVVKLKVGETISVFLSFNSRTLRYKCVPLDADGMPDLEADVRGDSGVPQ